MGCGVWLPSVGSIGSGCRRELQLDANLPLDGAGLPGVTVKGPGLRGGSPLDYLDERILRSGHCFGINVQRPVADRQQLLQNN